MRETKYRGKRIDGCNNWVYGSLVTDGKTAYIVTSYKTNSLDNYILDITAHPVILETVGQYTGRDDMNSKEVYEGDFLHDGDEYAKVEFYEGHWEVWSDNLYDLCMDENEVIGNMHENPELLEVSRG